MRRFAFIVLTSLATLALVAPAVQASHGSHRPAPSFTAKTSAAAQGGAMHVVAKVKHAQRGSTFSATATVHFASGDQTVTLTRHGKSFVAKGRVAVASDETPGSVPVDVTVTYNGDDTDVETQGNVEQGDDQGDDQGEDSQAPCDPATTTCDDQGDNNQGDQNDDNQGDDNGGDSGS
jgi:hypothetical protein